MDDARAVRGRMRRHRRGGRRGCGLCGGGLLGGGGSGLRGGIGAMARVVGGLRRGVRALVGRIYRGLRCGAGLRGIVLRGVELLVMRRCAWPSAVSASSDARVAASNASSLWPALRSSCAVASAASARRREPGVLAAGADLVGGVDLRLGLIDRRARAIGLAGDRRNRAHHRAEQRRRRRATSIDKRDMNGHSCKYLMRRSNGRRLRLFLACLVAMVFECLRMIARWNAYYQANRRSTREMRDFRGRSSTAIAFVGARRSMVPSRARALTRRVPPPNSAQPCTR